MGEGEKTTDVIQPVNPEAPGKIEAGKGIAVFEELMSYLEQAELRNPQISLVTGLWPHAKREGLFDPPYNGIPTEVSGSVSNAKGLISEALREDDESGKWVEIIEGRLLKVKPRRNVDGTPMASLNDPYDFYKFAIVMEASVYLDGSSVHVGIPASGWDESSKTDRVPEREFGYWDFGPRHGRPSEPTIRVTQSYSDGTNHKTCRFFADVPPRPSIK